MTNLNILTVDEFASLAPDIDRTRFNDPTISGMISAASQIVSDYLGYTPLAEDIVDEVKEAKISTDGDLLIFPVKLPVITLSAINLFKGATSVGVGLTSGNGVEKYNLDFNRRMIRYPYWEITLQGTPVFSDFYALKGRQFYTKISYRGGFEVSQLPGTIKLATVYIMRDLLSPTYNTTGASRISQGGVSLEFRNGIGQSKSQNVLTAEKLLNDYRRIG